MNNISTQHTRTFSNGVVPEQWKRSVITPVPKYLDPCLFLRVFVSVKLLGVTFSNTLRFGEHVKNILTIYDQLCYLLKCLKGQGLPSAQLNIVFCAIILSRILYALPAWGGFLTVELTNKIDIFSARLSSGDTHRKLPL